jgi:hypothetical protein
MDGSNKYLRAILNSIHIHASALHSHSLHSQIQAHFNVQNDSIRTAHRNTTKVGRAMKIQSKAHRTTGIKGYMVCYELMPDLDETKKRRTCWCCFHFTNGR